MFPLDRSLKIGVIGAGAIGGISAALLSQAGLDVEISVRNRTTADEINSKGLNIIGLKNASAVKIPAYENPSQFSGKKDLILLAVKAVDCFEAARALLPILHESSMVVSLQNGIVEPDLCDILGPERVVGCVVGWSATRLEPAKMEMTAGGEFIIGYLDRPPDERLEFLNDLMSEIVDCRCTDNMMGELFSKLAINSCTNTLTVISGLDLSPLLTTKIARELFIGILRETLALSLAMDVKIEPAGGGSLDFHKFLNGRGLLDNFKRHFIIKMIGRKFKKVRVSSLQSMDRGQKTEIDFFNGYIVEKGKEHGVPVPINEALTKMVREIEAGHRPMDTQNLNDQNLLAALQGN